MRFLRVPVKTLVKVGAFIALSAVLTTGLGVKIGNLRLFSHTYSLRAQFADASGVFKGDAVKLAGVDVGRVEGAEIDHGLAVVAFNVNESVKITTDSVVGIRWRNVLGQRFLYIYPGDGKGRVLKDGDTIPVSHTEDAGDIGAFLNKLGPILQAIDPDKANAFLDAVNSALAGNEGNVRGLISDAATLTGRLGDMDEEIKTLISSSDTVMSTYAAQNEAIAKIIDDLNSVGGRLEGMTGDINTFITDFADVQQQMDRLLSEQRSNIDFDLQALDSVSGTLEKSKGDLATTLCSLPPGLAGYFQTTSWGEWFNVRIVEAVVKDENGNQLFNVKEAPDTRASKDPNPVYRCSGGPRIPKGGPAQRTSGGSGTGAPVQAPTGSTQGFQDLHSYMDSLLGEPSAKPSKEGANA